MRIVSLLPSATEIVAALGAADSLVGVSHGCDYPKEIAGLPVVTSCVVPKEATSMEIDTVVRGQLEESAALYAIDTDLLASLSPDVLVTQALCDVCAVSGVEVEAAVAALHGSPTIVNMEPFSLGDVIDTVRTLGREIGLENNAGEVATDLQKRIDAVANRTAARAGYRPKTMVLDWIDPPFVSGHWMHDLIELAGGDDIMGTKDTPSYSSDWDSLRAMTPEVLVIACCGFSQERTRAEIALSGVDKILHDFEEAGTRVFVLDGNALFSRPGPRLVDSLELLAHHLHPDIHPLPDIDL